MDVMDAILSRRSWRGKYKKDPVPREDLTRILEAGLAAPSGCNKQTVSLIAVDDREVLERLRAVILPPVGETAPAMICVLTQRITAYRDRCFSVQDYAAAIENMLLAIVSLGYQSCWYEGHITDTDRIGDQMARILGVPEGYELVCFLPVGRAEGEAAAPRKKGFAERAFFNAFGKGPAFAAAPRSSFRKGSKTEDSLRLFDNHDPRLPYYDLFLERPLTDPGESSLPEGYRFVPYAPGDREVWIDIEISAREFDTREEGLEAWERYYGAQEEKLKDRMFFVVDPRGEKVATATAWHDIRREDGAACGMLHWVAVRGEEQGKGLSKPLILHILRVMASFGCVHTTVHTQTTTWLACKVYLDMGFRPTAENAEKSRRGWEIVHALTDHPALESFGKADLSAFIENN